MAKDTFYFSHDYNTRTDIKIKKLIQKHGYVGYGIFWAIVEDLYNNANALPADYVSIAYDLREDESLIISIINDFDLFIIDNEIISSESVERRLILRGAKTDAARAAALARWEKEREKKILNDANALNNDANAMQTECKGNAIKESKIKENKVKEIKEVINYEPDQEIINKKITKLKQAFIENDFDNTLQLFKDLFLTEEKLNEALKDYCINIGTSGGSVPANFKVFREWFKEWLKKNIKSYQVIPKKRYKIIAPDFYPLDHLYLMFKLERDPNNNREDIIKKINNGEIEANENSDMLIFGVQRGAIEIV